jgi:uncharacterized damage-inducible protein DinB
MSISETLLAEIEHEAATTRKLLERVPEDKLAWKPHAKSMSLGGLSTHVANLPHWGLITMSQSELDMAAYGRLAEARSRAELLAAFDGHVNALRAALAGKTDAEFMAPWTLKRGDQTVFTMPKLAVLRSFMMNHVIHHRGQLSVYLRLNDVPLPPIYGPTADEN